MPNRTPEGQTTRGRPLWPWRDPTGRPRTTRLRLPAQPNRPNRSGRIALNSNNEEHAGRRGFTVVVVVGAVAEIERLVRIFATDRRFDSVDRRGRRRVHSASREARIVARLENLKPERVE